MTIADAVNSELPGLRSQAESQMLDVFTAYAPSTDGPVPDGQLESNVYTDQGTTPGKIQSRTGGLGQAGDTGSREVTVGGVPRQVVEGGLHIPVDAPPPAAGDLGVGWEYVLTVPGPATPPELVGSRWLVLNAPAKSYMTARRLDVVRLDQGGPP